MLLSDAMKFSLYIGLLLSNFPFLCESSFFRLARSLLSSRKGTTIGWDGMRTLCDTTPECVSLPAGGEVGCVTRCMSPRCSKRAHGPEGLEPGEVARRDHSSDFRKCLRASERPLKRAGLWPPRLNEDGTALSDTDEIDQVYFALPETFTPTTSTTPPPQILADTDITTTLKPTKLPLLAAGENDDTFLPDEL